MLKGGMFIIIAGYSGPQSSTTRDRTVARHHILKRQRVQRDLNKPQF